MWKIFINKQNSFFLFFSPNNSWCITIVNTNKTLRFHDYLQNIKISRLSTQLNIFTTYFLHWPSLVRKQKWFIEIRKGFILKHFTSTFEWTKKRCWCKVLTVLIHIFLYDYDTFFLIWHKSWPHCQDIGPSYKRHIYQNQYNTIVVFLSYFIHENALVLGYFRYLNYMRVIAFCKLALLVPILLVERCTRYNIMWYSLSVTCGRSVVFHRVLRFPPPIKLTATV